MAGSKATLELDGAHAKIHLHVNDPSFYLSLNAPDDAEQVVSRAMVVNTGGAKEVASRKHGAHSATSGFAIVRVDERRAVRVVGAIHMSPNGTSSSPNQRGLTSSDSAAWPSNTHVTNTSAV